MDSWERRRRQSDATAEAQELLTELLQLYTVAEKHRKKRWSCWAETPKQPVISVEVRALLHVRTLDVIDYVFTCTVSTINIPQRHIWVSLVPRPLSRFYVGSGYRDYFGHEWSLA